MGSVVLRVCRFAGAQETYFQSAKRSNMGSRVKQRGQFPDAQEPHIPSSNHSEIGCVLVEGDEFFMFRNRIFRLRNCYILAFRLTNGVDFLMIRKTFPGCETFRYGRCRTAIISIL